MSGGRTLVGSMPFCEPQTQRIKGQRAQVNPLVPAPYNRAFASFMASSVVT